MLCQLGLAKRKGLSEKVTTRLHDVACRNLRIVLEEIKKGGCSSAVALFGNGQRAERVVLIACWQHLAAFKSEDSSTGSWIPCLRSEQGTAGCCTSDLTASPDTAESDSRPLEPFLVIGSWPSTALTSKASPAGRVSRPGRRSRATPNPKLVWCYGALRHVPPVARACVAFVVRQMR